MSMTTLLIANRGEIARRILRSAHDMGIRCVAVYTAADAGAPFVREADEAVLLATSYLDGKAILETIKGELRARVAALAERGVVPGLGTVLVGIIMVRGAWIGAVWRETEPDARAVERALRPVPAGAAVLPLALPRNGCRVLAIG